ncbi:deoxyribodipyrimidine photolyase [Photobacterium rosenbergii]|uniref:Cryptochrome DASH n=1 Tax=Photobacterium rosenbergii TaxID=294936 RepID=A0A2T3NM43_9GAMM|nr:DASH family cryptochrome [Photobacterium rosenbergii]PSW16532.1 deoxyribodipyrimidine photolyase [Photobacterium rosenbergii]
MATGLFLFQNDLRLHDNPALALATQEADHLICVYCLPVDNANRYPYHIDKHGNYRKQFLLQSLNNLSERLSERGQSLHVILEHPLNVLPELISQYNISMIYTSENAGVYEKRNWHTLKGRYPYITFRQIATHTLFDRTDLPFDINESLPGTFSQFRKQVEGLDIRSPLTTIAKLPPPPGRLKAFDVISSMINPKLLADFEGGEKAALKHLEQYFSSNAPSSYKQTRNELDGWENSTKFSPWLALGSLSANMLIKHLNQYETDVECNDSTQWIKFELLWREYFQWYAHFHGTRLYTFSGIKKKSPHTAYYPERFRRWSEGNTPYPLVNALMNQLRQTGYMSNRGRQIVASCLINELSLDWRYGAAFFEEHLLDYDTASNWGNWQYLAGVGADPQDNRHFNLAKQTEIYDPNGEFIRKWGGNNHDGSIDSVDAADWPIY